MALPFNDSGNSSCAVGAIGCDWSLVSPSVPSAFPCGFAFGLFELVLSQWASVHIVYPYDELVACQIAGMRSVDSFACLFALACSQ